MRSAEHTQGQMKKKKERERDSSSQVKKKKKKGRDLEEIEWKRRVQPKEKPQIDRKTDKS